MEKYPLRQLAGGLPYFKPGFGTAVGEATHPPTVAECDFIRSGRYTAQIRDTPFFFLACQHPLFVLLIKMIIMIKRSQP